MPAATDERMLDVEPVSIIGYSYGALTAAQLAAGEPFVAARIFAHVAFEAM